MGTIYLVIWKPYEFSKSNGVAYICSRRVSHLAVIARATPQCVLPPPWHTEKLSFSFSCRLTSDTITCTDCAVLARLVHADQTVFTEPCSLDFVRAAGGWCVWVYLQQECMRNPLSSNQNFDRSFWWIEIFFYFEKKKK